jgi:putative transposase
MSPIRAAGARLWYLPPYSPDLNPIEQTFAKIKHWMRMAQKRTINDTCAKSATSLLLLSPANAATTSRTMDTLLSKYEPL